LQILPSGPTVFSDWGLPLARHGTQSRTLVVNSVKSLRFRAGAKSIYLFSDSSPLPSHSLGNSSGVGGGEVMLGWPPRVAGADAGISGYCPPKSSCRCKATVTLTVFFRFWSFFPVFRGGAVGRSWDTWSRQV